MELELPLIKLRDYQEDIWDKLINLDYKETILVWHRRAGKDLFCLNYLIARALMDVGNYWFILPEAQQVRKAIWEGVTKDGVKYLDFFPKEMVHKIDNQSMTVHLKNPDNMSEVGSIVSFVGGDRYDKRVGAGIKGAIVSEWALQKPMLWELALEPMLIETGGWVVFNTTPRGENHASDTYENMKKMDDCLASLLTIDDTNIVDPSVIQRQRERGKPEEIIQQEYYCSFEGAIHGSYYGDILKKLKKTQVMNVPYDGQALVHTIWDLGVSDSMAIWFIQFVGREIRVLDYYEASGFGLSHYASVIQSKPYNYCFHNLPHDGGNRTLSATEKAMTIEQQLRTLGLENVRCIPRTNDVYGDIQMVRSILSRCVFDEVKTKEGYSCLKQYRREWNEKMARFKDSPLHDWSSHGADAFRILPYILQQSGGVKKMQTIRFKGLKI